MRTTPIGRHGAGPRGWRGWRGTVTRMTRTGRHAARRRGWRGLRGAVACLALGIVAAGLSAVSSGAPASAGTLAFVTAGGNHSCALTPGQRIWCWGLNTTGQLGNGTTTDSLTPVRVDTMPAAIGVSAGHDHTCAIDPSHQVWCWGSNAFGELGNGKSAVAEKFPVLAQGVLALQVSAGDGFTCAVTLAHMVDCWGDNNYGELGGGSFKDASTPQPVKGLTNVTQVAAGYFHACALESSGTIWCWGDNGDGELGINSTTPLSSDKPVEAAIETAIYVAAGAGDTCAIISGGALKCWGTNNVGQLGVGDFTDHFLPTAVAGLTSGVTQVSLGEDFGCAITGGPAAMCWGDNNGDGQLGAGLLNQPADIPALVPVFGMMETRRRIRRPCSCRSARTTRAPWWLLGRSSAGGSASSETSAMARKPTGRCQPRLSASRWRRGRSIWCRPASRPAAR